MRCHWRPSPTAAALPRPLLCAQTLASPPAPPGEREARREAAAEGGRGRALRQAGRNGAVARRPRGKARRARGPRRRDGQRGAACRRGRRARHRRCHHGGVRLPLGVPGAGGSALEWGFAGPALPHAAGPKRMQRPEAGLLCGCRACGPAPRRAGKGLGAAARQKLSSKVVRVFVFVCKKLFRGRWAARMGARAPRNPPHPSPPPKPPSHTTPPTP